MKNITAIIITILCGSAFGWTLIESQAISWYRIREMFLFQSFHMYGLLGSAVLTGIISVQVIRRFRVKSIQGNPVVLKPKPLTWKANVLGGLLFGFGWGLTGACSAPLYVFLGFRWEIGLILFIGALAGTFLYGALKSKIPH